MRSGMPQRPQDAAAKIRLSDNASLGGIRHTLYTYRTHAQYPCAKTDHMHAAKATAAVLCDTLYTVNQWCAFTAPLGYAPIPSEPIPSTSRTACQSSLPRFHSILDGCRWTGELPAGSRDEAMQSRRRVAAIFGRCGGYLVTTCGMSVAIRVS